MQAYRHAAIQMCRHAFQLEKLKKAFRLENNSNCITFAMIAEFNTLQVRSATRLVQRHHRCNDHMRGHVSIWETCELNTMLSLVQPSNWANLGYTEARYTHGSCNLQRISWNAYLPIERTWFMSCNLQQISIYEFHADCKHKLNSSHLPIEQTWFTPKIISKLILQEEQSATLLLQRHHRCNDHMRRHASIWETCELNTMLSLVQPSNWANLSYTEARHTHGCCNLQHISWEAYLPTEQIWFMSCNLQHISIYVRQADCRHKLKSSHLLTEQSWFTPKIILKLKI